MTRELHIDGLINVRELGGLRTRSGETVRRGRIIRSESLFFLTDVGKRQIRDHLNPRLVIDLREDFEVEHMPYVLEGPEVDIVCIPMSPLIAVTEEEVRAGQPVTLLDDYLGQLEANALSLAEAVNRLSDSANAPTVVHCTSGKDRTGVLVALVLSMIGVPDTDVADDYALTARCVPALIDRVQRIRILSDVGLLTAGDEVFSARADTMLGFLDGVRSRFGGAQSWAQWAGVEPETIERLRSSLVC